MQEVSYQLAGADSTGVNKVCPMVAVIHVCGGRLTFDLGCSSPFLGGNECDKCIQCVSTRYLSVLETINHSNAAITPWIAFVSCDTNVTNDSTTDDIFTIARDSGAVAAVRSFHPIYIFQRATEQ